MPQALCVVGHYKYSPNYGSNSQPLMGDARKEGCLNYIGPLDSHALAYLLSQCPTVVLTVCFGLFAVWQRQWLLWKSHWILELASVAFFFLFAQSYGNSNFWWFCERYSAAVTCCTLAGADNWAVQAIRVLVFAAIAKTFVRVAVKILIGAHKVPGAELYGMMDTENGNHAFYLKNMLCSIIICMSLVQSVVTAIKTDNSSGSSRRIRGYKENMSLWVWLAQLRVAVVSYARNHFKEESPVTIRYVEHDMVGIELRLPKTYKVYLDDAEWPRVVYQAASNLLVIYGLKPSTAYNLKICFSTDNTQFSLQICTNLVENKKNCSSSKTRCNLLQSVKDAAAAVHKERISLDKMQKASAAESSELQKQLSMAEENLARLTKSSDRMRATLPNLQHAVQQLHAEIDQIKEATTSLELTIPISTKAYELHKRQYETQQEALAEIRSRLDRAKRDWAAEQLKLEDSVAQLEQEVLKIENEIEKAKMSTALAEEKLQSVIQSAVEQVRSQRKQKQAYLQRTQSEFVSATKKLQEHTSTIRSRKKLGQRPLDFW